jgi:hypothetical protein
MEQFDFGKMIALGVVMDVSKRKEGKESLHFLLRRELIRLIQREQEYIRVFLHGSQIDRIPDTPGHCISIITDSRPDEFNVGLALKQTARLICKYLEDCDRHVILVTDRYGGRGGDQYDVASKVRESMMIDCCVHVVTVGPYCHANLHGFLNSESNFSQVRDSAGFGRYLERFSCQTKR